MTVAYGSGIVVKGKPEKEEETKNTKVVIKAPKPSVKIEASKPNNNKKSKEEKEEDKKISPYKYIEVVSEVNLEISDLMYWYLSKWYLEANGKETAGFASVIDGEIIFGVRCAIGVSSFVSTEMTTQKEALEILYKENEERVEGNLPPLVYNLQWHTHPGLSAFWSGTDVYGDKSGAGQREFVEDEINVASKGSYYFLVFDLGKCDWLVRKYWWDIKDIKDRPIQIYYADGTVTLDGLQLSSPKPVKVYTSSKTPESYYGWEGEGWGSDVWLDNYYDAQANPGSDESSIDKYYETYMANNSPDEFDLEFYISLYDEAAFDDLKEALLGLSLSWHSDAKEGLKQVGRSDVVKWMDKNFKFE